MYLPVSDMMLVHELQTLQKSKPIISQEIKALPEAVGGHSL